MTEVKPAKDVAELLDRLARWEAMPDMDLIPEWGAIRAERFIETETGGVRRVSVADPATHARIDSMTYAELVALRDARPQVAFDSGATYFRFGLFALRDKKPKDATVGLYTRVLDLEKRIRRALAAAESRSEVGRTGAHGKLAKNPVARAKADAKAGALNLWKERHAGKHPKLRTVKEFANEVMRRWPILESAKVIESWSAQWTKQVKEGKHPVC